MMIPLKVLCIFIAVFASSKANPFSQDELDAKMHPYRVEGNPRILNLELEQTEEYWKNISKERVAKQRREVYNTNIAKNVILFLGDGLSISTITAARDYMGKIDGTGGEESLLSFDKFPVSGLSKTYSVNSKISDSAGTSTAYLCGVKANDGTIGVTAKVRRGNCVDQSDTSAYVDSIATMFMNEGRSAGLVTTTRVTHASPAGVFAHIAERDWENDQRVKEWGNDWEQCKDIAYQLIHEDGKRLNVILGGGRREFLPNTTMDEEGYEGYRTDGRNLLEDWKKMHEEEEHNFEYVWNKTSLFEVDDNTDYLMGLFATSHLDYHLLANADMEPTLDEMTEAAIKVLSKNDKGFFLFVEGGKIDQGHHEAWARLALDETVEFSKAIARAVELTNSDETLIVVTSDHSHAMTINGYTRRGNDIMGKADTKTDDNIPYLVLSYANGPGYRKEVNGSRVDVTLEDMEDVQFQNPGMVPLVSETHAADDVGVFAYGPWQHLFTGVLEQSTIPYIMAFASCVNDDDSACSSGVINTSTLLFIFIINIILWFYNKE